LKILVFTEGTVIMHASGKGHTREEIFAQVIKKDKAVFSWASYVPIGNAIAKLTTWNNQGAGIIYLTSREKTAEVQSIQKVLRKHGFPVGRLLFRNRNQEYKDIAEEVAPNILVEDDCESIGGVDKMTITHVRPEIRTKIKSIPVKEFGGIDHLPDNIAELLSVNPFK
jgi:hypothetical protein